ncbi:MAG: ABC transporter substrate-binding protein [Desulfobacteraceae bacterium]|jgi:phospholipid transport system substrate-binding protein
MASKNCLIMLCIVFLTADLSIAANKTMSPVKTLQRSFDQIIVILNDPSYKAGQKKAVQRNTIWRIARPIFNFDEISRRVVGKPWNNFSPEEKKRFSAVFSKFLGATYINKLQGEFNQVQIDFDKELVKGSKAIVRTRLRRENLEIPIDYRMHRVNDSWKIYDILLEDGLSLVKNYRVQFNSILKNNTPAQLIEQLERKLTQQYPST